MFFYYEVKNNAPTLFVSGIFRNFIKQQITTIFFTDWDEDELNGEKIENCFANRLTTFEFFSTCIYRDINKNIFNIMLWEVYIHYSYENS